MNTSTQPIIDVEPVASAREATGTRSTPEAAYRAPSYGRPPRAGAGRSGTPQQPSPFSHAGTAQRPGAARTVIIDDSPTGPGARAGSRIGGAVQTAGGLALMAVGVPMLILPGPGVLAIAGGAALAGSGVKKLLRK